MDNMFANSAYWAGAGTVVAALMDYYGMPLWLTNLIAGFTSTLPVLQMAGSGMYQRTTHPARMTRGLSVAWRAMLPVCFFSVLLPMPLGAAVAPLAYLTALVLNQLVGPAMNDWMVNSLNRKISSDYYALRETAFMVMVTVSSCAVNLSLSWGQKQNTMRLAFLFCAVFLSVSLACSVPPLFRIDPPRPMPRTARISPRKALADRIFRPVLAAGVLWSFAGMFLGSYATTYQIQVLHLPFETILLWSVAGNLLRALCTPLMNRAAERIGWKYVCFGCMGLVSATGVLWLLMTENTLWLLFPACCLINAVAYAGLGVGMFKLQLEHMPSAAQGVYFAANAACTGIAACLGSVLCSATISGFGRLGWALNLIFAIGLVLSVGAALLVRRVPDPASRSAA